MTEGAPDAAVDPLGLIARSHPLRATFAQEMHLRRLPRFAAPARLLQIVVLLDETSADTAEALVVGLAAGEVRARAESARHALFELGALRGVCERHSEFATFGFLLPGAFADPFDPADFAGLRPLVARLPGPVVRATLVALAARGDEEALAMRAIARFGEDGLVSCDVADGKARIWSDFRLGADGLGRLLIADRGLAGDEPAQLVQQLQELGNYRNMALLGLPAVRRLTPALGALEQRLAVLTTQIAEPETADDALLEETVALSADLAGLLAETRYRMSATQAYATIVEERLAKLGIAALPGHQTLTDFTDRRLMPAVRTCATFTQRLDELSQRAAWTSGLLRTRIDTALARQNRDLLHSMDRRATLQLRLQQAVEGLSVVAISYYLVALVSTIIAPVTGLPHDEVAGIAAPVVIVVVALVLWRLRRRLHE